jgi:hypothetical protein
MAQLRPVLHPKFYIQAEAVVDRPVNFHAGQQALPFVDRTTDIWRKRCRARRH